MTITHTELAPQTENDDAPRVHQLIGGVWGPSDNGHWRPVENPARRTTLAYIPDSGESDVNRAVDAATEAFKTWGVLPARERGRLLTAIGDKIAENQEELARIIASETGNALRTQSRGEAACQRRRVPLLRGNRVRAEGGDSSVRRIPAQLHGP
jgi:acyl-CoA reductase-like NAD-dependent aldehyde dehydrogenase